MEFKYIPSLSASTLIGRIESRREDLKRKKIETVKALFDAAIDDTKKEGIVQTFERIIPLVQSANNPNGFSEFDIMSDKKRRKLKKEGENVKDGDHWIMHGFDSFESFCSPIYRSLSYTLDETVQKIISEAIKVRPIRVSLNRKIVWTSEDAKEALFEGLKDLGFVRCSKWPGTRVFRVNEKNQPTDTVYIDQDMDGFNGIFSDEKLALVVSDIFSKAIGLVMESVKLTTINSIGPDGLDTTDEMLGLDDSLISPPAFYPWMEGMEPGQYFAEFLESEANVLLLYGLPGTGKSSLIRSGLIKTGVSALAIVDSSLAKDASLVSMIGNKMRDADYGVLIIEDADALMKPRSEGNITLNKLLAATSGIGNKGSFKIVLTTNALTTEHIDPALLRPGRCFDVMEFGRLTPEEANAARRAIGMDPAVIRTPVILAAAVSDNPSQTMKSAKDGESSICSPRFPLKKRH